MVVALLMGLNASTKVKIFGWLVLENKVLT
jgi:hypothetical protein